MSKRTILIGGVSIVVGACLYGTGLLVGALLLPFGALLVLLRMIPEIVDTCPRCKHDIRQGTRRCPHCGNTIARAHSAFESIGHGLMLPRRPIR